MAGLFEDFDPMARLPANQYGLAQSASVTKGSLISFYYPQSYATIPNIIHDHYPMVIVTDVWRSYVRGVNLHYLTFPYVKALLTKFGENTSFSYSHIKPDVYMAQAFRMYVRAGIRRPRKLDTKWLTQVLGSVRSFNPGEIEKIRANIQKQIQNRLQAKAKELTSYEQWRKSLNQQQQRQVQNRVKDVESAVTRGPQQNLTHNIPEDAEPTFGTGPIIDVNPQNDLVDNENM